jgi:hypothetical protein
MGVLRRYWWVLLIAVVVLFFVFVYRRPPGVTTELQLEAYGGFAYIPNPAGNRLDIAYLKTTNVPGCNVTQLGVELRVIEGNIVEPANYPDRSKTFDLAGAVVKFPDLATTSTPLAAVRGARPTAAPFGPQDPKRDDEWHDLKWVPSALSEVPGARLNPAWEGLVDGRLELKGGTIRALYPSDVVVRDAVFEFKNATTSFRQAITDRTEYLVSVPSDRVVMTLTGQKQGITRIVVTPQVPGGRVRLKLSGIHEQPPAPLPMGHVLKEHCAFYQLMDPVPPQGAWFIPELTTPAAAATATGGQPSPGRFCPGDWFFRGV